MSRLSSDIYPMISAACNILPFLLQISGAAILSNDIYKGQSLTRGANLMIAGLSFQILTLVLFGVLCIEYAIRVHCQPELFDQLTLRTRSTKRFRFFWLAISFSSVLVMIRCIYLVTALSLGWRGTLMQSEVKFLVLDGAYVQFDLYNLTCILICLRMVVATGYALSIVHPGYVFQQAPENNEKNFEELTGE